METVPNVQGVFFKAAGACCLWIPCPSRAGVPWMLAGTKKEKAFPSSSSAPTSCSQRFTLITKWAVNSLLAKEHLIFFFARSRSCNSTELSQLVLRQTNTDSGQRVVLCSQKQVGKEGRDEKKQEACSWWQDVEVAHVVFSVGISTECLRVCLQRHNSLLCPSLAKIKPALAELLANIPAL